VCNIQQKLENNQIALQVDSEMVGGTGKSRKILRLIEYFDKRGYLCYLVDVVRKDQPDII